MYYKTNYSKNSSTNGHIYYIHVPKIERKNNKLFKTETY